MEKIYNPNELKAERARKGLTATKMAGLIGCSPDLYRKKERGDVSFSDAEKICIIKILHLNLAAVNRIFFDNQLPKK